MDEREHDYERRKQQRFRNLGTDEPRCACCGHDRWQALELHHVAGQSHDDQIVILCRNCHRELSDAQRDHPPKQASADPYLEMIGRFLLGLADMLRLLLDRLVEFGEELIARAALPPSAEGSAP